MITADQLKNRFRYHQPPNDLVTHTHSNVRVACFMAAEEIVKVTPECREQSTAITKLEEAMYWANAAVARNHAHYVPTEAVEGVD